MIGEGYFTIIRETERYIEFFSNNTKHCWIICKNQDGTDKPVMIYHKHSRKTEYYHRHWKTWSVVNAVKSIKRHGDSDIRVTLNTYTYLELEGDMDGMLQMGKLEKARNELEKTKGES